MDPGPNLYQRAISTAVESALGWSGRGDPADRPDLHGDLPGLPAALGRGLARIHGVPLPDPIEAFDMHAVVARRLAAGRIATRDLPDPYNRYGADQLVNFLVDAELPDHHQGPPVTTVGNLTLDRLLLADGEVEGIEGLFGLAADRHLDLAVLQHSIHHRLGAEAVFGFYEAYGTDPNIVALDHHVLAGLLLGWIR